MHKMYYLKHKGFMQTKKTNFSSKKIINVNCMKAYINYN